MPPAARVGDPTAHGGVLAAPPPGPFTARVATVFIGGKPAAVAGSVNACGPHAYLALTNLVKPVPGAATTRRVLIGGLPAACATDDTVCGSKIVAGAPNVLIGGPL
ncbi:PAAR domain-containing protein [Streptomyces sp. NPDC047981]|uniref:PAAR domain-containing protein n=1 Tax=Streptomyces sp. NPDC047981 TaxID=3154610 RepID=UPI0034130678